MFRADQKEREILLHEIYQLEIKAEIIQGERKRMCCLPFALAFGPQFSSGFGMNRETLSLFREARASLSSMITWGSFSRIALPGEFKFLRETG